MTVGGTLSTLDAISAHHARARCHPPHECQLRQQLYTTHMTEELKHHQQHQEPIARAGTLGIGNQLIGATTVGTGGD